MDPGTHGIIDAPPARPARAWGIFLAGMALGGLLPVGIAFTSGPRTKTVSEDPLTGRIMHASTWLGIRLSARIEENDVSEWADGNSIPGMYPARYGWSVVTREDKGWFTPTSIACGGYGIPGQIFRGRIAIDGLTREEVLRKYQSELAVSFKEHGSTNSIQEQWRSKAR